MIERPEQDPAPPAPTPPRRSLFRRKGSGRSPRAAAFAGLLAGLLIAMLIGAFVVAPLALTHRSNWPLETSFGRFAVNLAVGARSGNTGNPRSVDQQAVELGRNSFTGSCAYCHGSKGDGKGGALSASLFPPATDLTKGDAKAKTDAQLFWITKQGLSFTAMPGFGGAFNDDAIWSIVAYVRSLQGKNSVAVPTAVTVPTPGVEQLAVANLNGDAVARGAATYFAQSCFQCHGAAGNASGQLALRMLGTDAEVACQIRYGPNGMPAFDSSKLSDAQVADVIAFLRTLVSPNQNQAGAGQGRPPGGGPPGGGPPRGTPAPDRYSGTAHGEAPSCIPPRGVPGGSPPGAGAGTPRPGRAADTATPAP